MAVFQGASGLAEDRFINVFHFDNGDAYSDHRDAVTGALLDFYLGVGTEGPPQFDAIGRYLSPYVSRFFDIRTYDLSTPIPRVPTVVGGLLPAPNSSQGMPEECAVVLTLHGVPPVTARRRGRVYIGPLGSVAVTPASSSLPARPTSNFCGDLTIAAVRLADSAINANGWSIRSSVPNVNYVDVASGYVDNALDTQRRRGPDPTIRFPFLVANI
jgi:hypothetical protein